MGSSLYDERQEEKAGTPMEYTYSISTIIGYLHEAHDLLYRMQQRPEYTDHLEQLKTCSRFIAGEKLRLEAHRDEYRSRICGQ